MKLKLVDIRDGVCVDGCDEEFHVVWADNNHGVADLACIERVGFLSHVLIAKIQLVEDPARRYSHILFLQVSIWMVKSPDDRTATANRPSGPHSPR
jgi:hypothetical protein